MSDLVDIKEDYKTTKGKGLYYKLLSKVQKAKDYAFNKISSLLKIFDLDIADYKYNEEDKNTFIDYVKDIVEDSFYVNDYRIEYVNETKKKTKILTNKTKEENKIINFLLNIINTELGFYVMILAYIYNGIIAENRKKVLICNFISICGCYFGGFIGENFCMLINRNNIYLNDFSVYFITCVTDISCGRIFDHIATKTYNMIEKSREKKKVYEKLASDKSH